MRKLYEIKNEIDLVFQAGDEFDPVDLEEQLTALGIERDEKLESIWMAIRNTEAEAAAFDAEAKRLADRAKSAKGRVESIKGYVANCLGQGIGWKSPSGIAEFGWHTCPPSVEIVNAEAVPLEYSRVSYTPDKTEIKKALQAGAEVAGCALITDKKTLKVK